MSLPMNSVNQHLICIPTPVYMTSAMLVYYHQLQSDVGMAHLVIHPISMCVICLQVGDLQSHEQLETI